MRDIFLNYRNDENLNLFETIDSRKIDEYVKEFFKFSNEKYILTDKIIKVVEPQKSFSVLDVGCGEGYVVRKIAQQVKHCVALDPDPKMLDMLKRQVKDSSVIFINKKLEDFETRMKFDVILSSHTLSFYRDKQWAINKMLDLTKKNGRLILVLHCRDSQQLEILKETFLAINGKEINHIYAEALNAYFVRQGFDPKFETVETVARFPSIKIPLKLSYFFFRIDYDEINSHKKHLIRAYLERKMQDRYIEISTLHGIISLRKRH